MMENTTCKHEGIFRVGELVATVKGTNPIIEFRLIMSCPSGCGFSLNFCPLTAGRFRCEEWKEKVTHFETVQTIVLDEIQQSARKPVESF